MCQARRLPRHVLVRPLDYMSDYMSPQTFTVTSSIGCFYFLVILFYNFSCRFRAVD